MTVTSPCYITFYVKQGDRYYSSGTSFAAPYVSAIVALWLQNKQLQAKASGVKIKSESINQDSVLRGLVATAAPIPDVWRPDSSDFLEPVARCGGGQCYCVMLLVILHFIVMFLYFDLLLAPDAWGLWLIHNFSPAPSHMLNTCHTCNNSRSHAICQQLLLLLQASCRRTLSCSTRSAWIP